VGHTTWTAELIRLQSSLPRLRQKKAEKKELMTSEELLDFRAYCPVPPPATALRLKIGM
jgi:hypothetical protein